MIIKAPKPELGFGFRDFGFWDLVWLGLGVANKPVHFGGSLDFLYCTQYFNYKKINHGN